MHPMKNFLLAFILFQAAAFAALPPELTADLASPDLAKRFAADMELRRLVSAAGKPGADPAARAALEKELLALAADAKQPELVRLAALVQMPYFGTAAAVPVLAGLLGDPLPAIREQARCGLQNNPDPAANAPLRDALSKASDPVWELGVMQALVHRGDEASLPLLAERLDSKDPRIAALAAQGLGLFGDDGSLGQLIKAAGQADPGLKPAMQSAAIRCAARLKSPESARALLALWPDAANAAIRSDIFAALLARGDEAAAGEILAAVMAKPETPGAAAILHAAVISDRAPLSAAVVAALPKLPPRERLAVHSAFAGRGETRHEDDLLALAAELGGPERTTAVTYLASCGTEKSLPFLAKEAQGGPTAAAAALAVNRLKVEGLDQRLLDSAGKGSGEEQLEAIRLLALRNPAGTEATLLQLAEPASPQGPRDAAVAALQTVGGYDAALQLIRWVAEVPAAAVKPYQGAFRRLAPRISAADALWKEGFAPAYMAAAPDKQTALLVLVPGIYSPGTALAIVEWIKAGRPDRGALIGQLLAWRNFDVSQALLQTAMLPDLDEATRTKLFQAATRLLYPNVNAKPPQKMQYAKDLLAAAPEGPIRTMVETSIEESKVGAPKPKPRKPNKKQPKQQKR